MHKQAKVSKMKNMCCRPNQLDHPHIHFRHILWRSNACVRIAAAPRMDLQTMQEFRF